MAGLYLLIGYRIGAVCYLACWSILLAAHAFLFTCVPFFGTVFLWLDGACNYLWGTALALWHLCSMESFGVAYTAPLSEGGLWAWLRTLLRPPLWVTRRRPEELAGEDKWNQSH